MAGGGGAGARQHRDGAGEAGAGDFGERPIFLGEAAVLEGGPVDLFGEKVAGPEEGGAGDGVLAVAEVEHEVGSRADGCKGLRDGCFGVFEQAEPADGDGRRVGGDGDGPDSEVVPLVGAAFVGGRWRWCGVVDWGELLSGPVVPDGEAKFRGEADGKQGREGDPFRRPMAEIGAEPGSLGGVDVARFEVGGSRELDATDGGGCKQEFAVRGEPE